MASYTRQMMTVAQKWLVANPDPDDAMIKIPDADHRRDAWVGHDKWLADREDLLGERADLAPLLGPHLDEIKRLAREREVAAGDLHDAERTLESMLNKGMMPAERKHDCAVGATLSILGRWCLAWARHGYNVLDLSSDFTAAMLLTDARDLDIAEIRMPFAGILMLIPDGFARGSEGGSYTKIHVTEVPRIAMNQLEVNDKVLSVLESLPQEARVRVVNKIEREIQSAGGLLPPKSLLGSPATCHVREPENDTALQIYATDGVRALDTFINRCDLTWDAFDDLPDTVTDETDKQARHTIRRVVFGALAYLAAVPSAMERREPTGKRRRRERDEPKVYDVGRTIRLDPQLVRAVRAGSREVALRIKHRHIVRGHYRNQPIGPGRQERKRIWIAPFWKGPADGAALIHTYKLDRSDIP